MRSRSRCRRLDGSSVRERWLRLRCLRLSSCLESFECRDELLKRNLPLWFGWVYSLAWGSGACDALGSEAFVGSVFIVDVCFEVRFLSLCEAVELRTGNCRSKRKLGGDKTS